MLKYLKSVSLHGNHYQDVTFGEDASRVRKGNAPDSIALLKRWSLNLLNQETSFKRSTRQKAMQRGLGGFPHERLHQDSEASQHGCKVFAQSS